MGNDEEPGTTLASCVAGPVHSVADLVEPVFEEVAVGVESHRRRGVSQHLLDDLDVGAARDGQTRGRVPELVRVEVGYADGPGRRAERGAEGAHSQGLAVADAGEDQVVGVLAVEVTCDIGGEELRDGDLASLVGLGSSPDEPQTLNRRDGLRDDGAVASQVDPADLDSLSGESVTYTVELTLDDKTYTGTAQWPQDETAEAPYTRFTFDPPLPAYRG